MYSAQTVPQNCKELTDLETSWLQPTQALEPNTLSPELAINPKHKNTF